MSEPLHFTVAFKGAAHALALPPDAPLSSLAAALAEECGVAPETIKLLGAKGGMIKPSEAPQRSLADAGGRCREQSGGRRGGGGGGAGGEVLRFGRAYLHAAVLERVISGIVPPPPPPAFVLPARRSRAHPKPRNRPVCAGIAPGARLKMLASSGSAVAAVQAARDLPGLAPLERELRR